ncbi:PDR/VanB family oxidoreductase [Sedimentitalea todarodis]|uniref:PDR/VanB family oxidoreductase n=1 Tax=Sedimentitalea todarodis TaxID=1631240 RepID=A0ABU3VHG3_9RHOB|nr:PDR/VanB family oxidoreductase [Sedimentitalea todarodis]MDU9005626.1 PDR/VanB family oxidoreductase [Sedimentitalea todarodis]
MTADQPRQVMVTGRRDLTPTITEFVLSPTPGGSLPPISAGAHATLRTPSGAMRRYSVINPELSPETYVIAVKRETDSRGGSASMHEQARLGTVMDLMEVENSFALTDAPDYLLIAGGIGITPILSMARELDRAGKPFRIIYCSRDARETAYLDEMSITYGDRLTLHHDGGDPAEVYDFWDHFEEPQKAHVFCCGPKPLMEEIRAISGHWPEGRVHFEDFKPVEVVRADDVAFDVELRKSGRTITVPADRSILEALRDAGERTVSSCESGTCGTCKTRLIAGDADHRDMVLMDEERAEKIMICVSRSAGGGLVLDL